MLLDRNPYSCDIILSLSPQLLPTLPLLLPATSRFLSVNSLSFPTLPTIYIITNSNHPAPTIANSAPTTPFLLLAPVNVGGELDFVVDAEDVADVRDEEAAECS